MGTELHKKFQIIPFNAESQRMVRPDSMEGINLIRQAEEGRKKETEKRSKDDWSGSLPTNKREGS